MLLLWRFNSATLKTTHPMSSHSSTASGCRCVNRVQDRTPCGQPSWLWLLVGSQAIAGAQQVRW
jgi:hypothetical protein